MKKIDSSKADIAENALKNGKLEFEVFINAPGGGSITHELANIDETVDALDKSGDVIGKVKVIITQMDSTTGAVL